MIRTLKFKKENYFIFIKVYEKDFQKSTNVETSKNNSYKFSYCLTLVWMYMLCELYAQIVYNCWIKLSSMKINNKNILYT